MVSLLDLFDLQMLILGGSLVALILANIFLGSSQSIIEGKFDKTKFKTGFLKGLIIGITFIVIYIIGSLNRDIIVVNLNGVDMDLLTSVYAITTIGYVWYAKEIVVKFTKIVGGKFDIKE